MWIVSWHVLDAGTVSMSSLQVHQVSSVWMVFCVQKKRPNSWVFPCFSTSFPVENRSNPLTLQLPYPGFTLPLDFVVGKRPDPSEAKDPSCWERPKLPPCHKASEVHIFQPWKTKQKKWINKYQKVSNRIKDVWTSSPFCFLLLRGFFRRWKVTWIDTAPSWALQSSCRRRNEKDPSSLPIPAGLRFNQPKPTEW